MSAKESMRRRKKARALAAKAKKAERIITKKAQPMWKGGGEKDDKGMTFRERNDKAAKELREKRKAAAKKAPAHNSAYATDADDGTESEASERLDAQPTVTRTDGANERRG